MDKKDIEELRRRVPCGAVLDKAGFQVDPVESTRKAVKYRRGDGRIVIVIHDGQGWFDPLSQAKGDVFSLAGHLLAGQLGARGFADALKAVAALVGFTPAEPAWTRPVRAGPAATLAGRWAARPKPQPGSPAWAYLADTRRLPGHIVLEAVEQDVLREGPRGSLWAAHLDAAGTVVGWEERGPAWRGFASGGAKVLFRLGAAEPGRVCVTEAAIDALSLAAIEGLRHGSAYVSTGGGWSPATTAALGALARPGTELVAATDSNFQGDTFGDRLRALATAAGARYSRLRPDRDDWNEDLQAIMGRTG